MASNNQKSKRGGTRPGAGRPPGSLNKRSVAAIEKVAEQYPDWSPLQHFANVANDETLDPVIRLDAAKAAAPFIHPRPKAVELDPDALVDLERRLVRIRLEAQAETLTDENLAARLERAARREIVVLTGVSRAPDDPLPEPAQPAVEADRPVARLSPPEDTPAPPAGPAMAPAAALPPPKPSYAPITSTMADNYSPFSNQD